MLVPQNKNPLGAKECQSLPEAEKHRRDAMREVTRKIASIQNGMIIFNYYLRFYYLFIYLFLLLRFYYFILFIS